MLLELWLGCSEGQPRVAPHEVLDAGHTRGIERRGHDDEIARDPLQLEQECLTLIRRDVLEHIARHHRVEGVVRKGQAGAVPVHRNCAGQPLGCGLDVEAHHVEPGIEGLEVAGTVTDVEDSEPTGAEAGAQCADDSPVAGIAIERGPRDLGELGAGVGAWCVLVEGHGSPRFCWGGPTARTVGG